MVEGVTERQVMEALSGYGKISVPSKKADLVKVREFKTLARLTLQLEDALKGIAPLKTGKQRDKATERVRELQKKVNEARKQVGIERLSEEEQLASGLDSSKTRIRNRIAELRSRISKGDYTEAAKREPALDREKIDLQYELAQVKEEFDKGVAAGRRAKRSTSRKIFESVGEAANLGRQLLTSGDLPPIFRQGFMSIGRPVTTGKAVADAFRAMFSEKKRFEIQREIDNRPNAPLYSRAKLYLGKKGSSVSQQEEAYMGNWFQSLPRWTLVGPFLRSSERAYNTFLNKLRADTFDAAVNAYDISPTDTATLSYVAEIINTMTGRAKLPGKKLEQAAAGLNTFLFAPRLVASRFKIVTGQPLWTGNAKSRKFALEQYGRTLAGAALIYALANMAGAELEADPRSSDFGKIKIGNTRLDPLGGLAQVTSFLTRVITGETKSGDSVKALRENLRPTVKIDELIGSSLSADSKARFGESTGTVMGRFLRTKLHPIAGSIYNIVDGTDLVGNPVSILPSESPDGKSQMGELVKLAVPISYQEILETMEEQGVPRGIALTILSMFGMGLQSYGND